MTRALPWMAGLALGLLAAGCARPRPAVVETPQPLAVPVVPPRVVAALPEDEPPEPATDPGPEPRRPARPRPRPRPATAETPPDAQRPDVAETAPIEPSKPPEAPRVLRTPDTADDSEAARRVREILSRARAHLARIDTRSLGRDARTQYETALRLLDQAEGALLARNYMFASYLADKADTLARGLLGR